RSSRRRRGRERLLQRTQAEPRRSVRDRQVERHSGLLAGKGVERCRRERELPGAGPGRADDLRDDFQPRPAPVAADPDAVVPTGPCGTQRPGINVAPAIAPDGTIYTVSRAHFRTRYGYVIAVNPDLTPKWAGSLRGHLSDGCNDGTQFSVLPPSGTPGGCIAGAH